MTRAGLQRSDVSEQHRLLTQAWNIAFAGLPVVYVSGPITTGPRFVRWYLEQGKALIRDRGRYNAQHRKQVIQPNERELLAAAHRLRLELREPVVEPASLSIAEWSQSDYVALWERFIETHARMIIMLPGWEFSAGCAAEFVRACERSIPVANDGGSAIGPADGWHLLRDAAANLKQLGVPIPGILNAATRLGRPNSDCPPSAAIISHHEEMRKDASLDRLAEIINVAQFISFEPAASPRQAYSRVRGHAPNHVFPNIRSGIEILLKNSADHSVNIRSFTPESPLSREFIYGLTSIEDATSALERLTSEGLYTIVNETIDVKDGGVSGVLMGDVLEFAPDDTPRCVEKPGVASISRRWGIQLLSSVYRFVPDLYVNFASRLEFSLHPRAQGWRNTHTIGWEYSSATPPDVEPQLTWPNRFSRMIGDKVFGLLIAHVGGLPVPRTTVINRRVAPFTFGQSTGLAEVWTRTSPPEQVPGKFTTTQGWIDPFKLFATEDPEGSTLASVIVQEAIRSGHSGAAIVTAEDKLIIEGKAGEGESLMRGQTPSERLPQHVIQDVERLYKQAHAVLGAVRFEWVHDGQQAWVVQLHRGGTQSSEGIIVPGQAKRWIQFDISLGLERLRETLAMTEPGEGLILLGKVGLTSHIADIIRRAGIPARTTQQ